MPNEYQTRAKIERRLARWPKQIRQRIAVCFPEVQTNGSVDVQLLAALENSTRSLENRVTLSYVAIHGKYPSGSESFRLQAILSAHGALPALASLLALETSASGRRREAIMSNGTVIDVTRYMEEFTKSGIPRVVELILSSHQFAHAKAIAWDDGAPCPVERSVSEGGTGTVSFTKKYWGKPHHRARRLGKLHARLMQYRSTFLVVSALNVALRSLILRRAFASRKPKFVLVIEDCKLLIPEVPTRELSDVLSNAIDAFARLDCTLILHDMLPLTVPQFFASDSVLNHVYLAKLATKRMRVVVATPIIGAELAAFAKFLNNGSSKVVQLALPAPMPTPEIVVSRESDLPYFVFMGGFNERKGLRELVDHIDAVSAELLNFQILVVGAPGATHSQLKLAARVKERSNIFEIKRQVSDRMLANLIAGSCGVLYPSFAEGYGLPILESVALGVPVLVRATPTNLWLAERYPQIDTNYSEFDPNLIQKLHTYAITKPARAENDLPKLQDVVTPWLNKLHEVVQANN